MLLAAAPLQVLSWRAVGLSSHQSGVFFTHPEMFRRSTVSSLRQAMGKEMAQASSPPPFAFLPIAETAPDTSELPSGNHISQHEISHNPKDVKDLKLPLFEQKGKVTPGCSFFFFSPSGGKKGGSTQPSAPLLS